MAGSPASGKGRVSSGMWIRLSPPATSDDTLGLVMSWLEEEGEREEVELFLLRRERRLDRDLLPDSLEGEMLIKEMGIKREF